MPIAFEPVLVVIQPIKYGEQNPARLAKLLTAAIPAAAETPPKKLVGNIQNKEDAVSTPEAAMQRQIKESVRFEANKVANVSAKAPAHIGIIKCQRRSWKWSPLRPAKIMTTMAHI